MRVEKSQFIVDQSLSVDIPDCRAYEAAEAALVDESLCQAIEAAAALESSFVVDVLADELRSHFDERGWRLEASQTPTTNQVR